MQRDVLWRAVGTLGLEHCTLHVADARVVLDGLVIAVVEGSPLRVAYTVTCDAQWRTRHVVVQLLATSRTLTLVADGAGSWHDGAGQPLPALDGCVDVDITITPATNTLPIRRLGLAPNQSSDIRVVYVGAPTLTLEPGEQRYTARSTRSYHFAALGSNFQADLTLDADGLVVDYPGLFERVWPGADVASGTASC